MKFSEKYELLESVTSGEVETFIANHKVRGERVLVHILDCGAQASGQPTLQWVLDAFHRLAPQPPGLVLETGRYSGTLYGYLVTQFPEPSKLQNWVRQYEARSSGAREIPPPAKQTVPRPDDGARPSGESSGSFTRAFGDFESQAAMRGQKDNDSRSSVLPGSSPLGNSGLRSAPGSFTEQFLGTPGPDAGMRLGRDSINPDATHKIPSLNDDGARSEPKAGEFTAFFRGPFSGDRPADVPVSSFREVEPPQAKVGEFTAMFGAMSPPSPATDKCETVVKESARDNSSFTSVFADINLPARNSEPPVLPSSPGLPGSQPTASEFPTITPLVSVPLPVPVAAQVPMTFPNPSAATPAADKPLPPLSVIGSSMSGATRSFSSPIEEAQPMPEPAFSPGPSEYTRIISRVNAAELSAEATEAGNPSPASRATLPKVAMPQSLRVPSPPPVPKLTAPPAPKAPKMDAGMQTPAASYWPLVLTLTILFFIGAIVVLYFVLKH